MAQVATVQNPEKLNRYVAIGAVIFAALAAVLLFVALQNRDDGGSGSAVATVDVVVAAQSISANETLTADMLRIEAVPQDSLLSGAYSETDAIVGVPLRYPVQEGEQITRAKIGASQIEDEKDVSYVLKPGQRGYAISVGEQSAVGGLLLAGNNVDVIAVYKNKDTDLIERSVTVLQNVTIVSVAQEAQEPVPGQSTDTDGTTGGTNDAAINGQRPDDIEREPDADTVTLALTSEQAQLMAALEIAENVTLSLALRPAGDTTPVELPVTELGAGIQ